MLVLLDQNVPIGVRRILAGHDVRTAYGMGWANLSNGELMNAAESGSVQVLVTCDQNIVFQCPKADRSGGSDDKPLGGDTDGSSED